MPISTRYSLARITGLTVFCLLLGCDKQKSVSLSVDINSNKNVITLNSNYSRQKSLVLIRQINHPTRAALDYAAYSANVMRKQPISSPCTTSTKITLDSLKRFSLFSRIVSSKNELYAPGNTNTQTIHFVPALDFLLTQDFSATTDLANGYGQITTHRWGCDEAPGPTQSLADLWIDSASGKTYAKLEFEPSFASQLLGFSDLDQDGYADAYVEINANIFKPQLAKKLLGTYSDSVLTAEEVQVWASELASHWYPSLNTDRKEENFNKWPTPETEADVRKELGTISTSHVVAVLKGKPFDQVIYNVFVIPGISPITSSDRGEASPEGNQSGNKEISHAISENLSEYLTPIIDQVDSELKKQGGSWESWAKSLLPFHKMVSNKLQGEKSETGALEALTPTRLRVGSKFERTASQANATLLFRRELEYLLQSQPISANQDPVKTIVAFRDSLEKLGIDFLFIPIPTKLDVYPEWIGGEKSPEWVQPYLFNIRSQLAKQNVETIDLLTVFKTERGYGFGDSLALYQRQDTHWTPRGIELAADAVAMRVMSYSWFAEVFPDEINFKLKDTTFVQLGDLHSRLMAESRAKFLPERIYASQVLDTGGKPLRDAPSSPVVVIGDSYTGVFQQVLPGSAGFSAHLAYHLKAPVDLVMGWGGGPEAPAKLMRRGSDYTKSKRLVIWVMSARDLLTYPGEWQKGT